MFKKEQIREKVPYVPLVDHLTISHPDVARRQEVKKQKPHPHSHKHTLMHACSRVNRGTRTYCIHMLTFTLCVSSVKVHFKLGYVGDGISKKKKKRRQHFLTKRFKNSEIDISDLSKFVQKNYKTIKR